jgi:hypothetical protein
MSHWAEIDENNIVLRVIVGTDDDPVEVHQWIVDNLGGTWLQTSYNSYGNKHRLGGAPFRKNYAGPGYKYDLERDAFIPPKPELPGQWTLDEETCLWVRVLPTL